MVPCCAFSIFNLSYVNPNSHCYSDCNIDIKKFSRHWLLKVKFCSQLCQINCYLCHRIQNNRPSTKFSVLMPDVPHLEIQIYPLSRTTTISIWTIVTSTLPTFQWPNSIQFLQNLNMPTILCHVVTTLAQTVGIFTTSGEVTCRANHHQSISRYSRWLVISLSWYYSEINVSSPSGVSSTNLGMSA